MLTIPVDQLPADQPVEAWVIEIDTEYGAVQVFGQAKVTYHPQANGYQDGMIESEETGGCYDDSRESLGVELFSAEEHYLAVFPDEESMKQGVEGVCAYFGDILPIGIYRGLTGN
jgi:hypothetical protein